MAERILVRGEIQSWMKTARILAALILVVGLVLLAIMGWLGGIVAAIGALSFAWLQAEIWRARRLQTWLTLHEDGLEIEDRRSHAAIHDSQVVAAALQTKKNLNNGVLASIDRRFSIWVQGSPQPILMENRINVGAKDPLSPLVDRLMNCLLGQFSKRSEERREGKIVGG